jgi:hypothetical protein
MPSFFRLNPLFKRELEAEVTYRLFLRGEAEAAARVANTLAHRIMPAGRGAVIEAQQDGDKVLIVNSAHGGHLDEWGSTHNPAYAPLRRGVRAAGLRLESE